MNDEERVRMECQRLIDRLTAAINQLRVIKAGGPMRATAVRELGEKCRSISYEGSVLYVELEELFMYCAEVEGESEDCAEIEGESEEG